MANETEENVDLTQESPEDSDLVKKLRAEIKSRNTELQSEREARLTTQKQATFRELGIDPNKGVGKLFFQSYDGELDSESVKNAAEEYELPMGQQQQTQEQSQQESEQSQQQEQQRREDVNANSKIDTASAGATPADSKTDPTEAGFKAFDETMRSTGSRDNAMAAHFSAKLQESIKAHNER